MNKKKEGKKRERESVFSSTAILSIFL